MTALLKEHLPGAVDVLTAAKAGDTAKPDEADKKWYANADEIATILSTANPKNWSEAAMKEGMKMHLDLTLAEATAQLKGETSASIQGYDKVHNHILGLAGTLSTGIIAAFPDKFTGQAPPAVLPTTGMDKSMNNMLWLALLAGAARFITGVIVLRSRPIKINDQGVGLPCTNHAHPGADHSKE